MREADIRKLESVESFFRHELEWLETYCDNKKRINSKYVDSVPCPCCGATCGEDIFTKFYFNFQKCLICKTIYVNPRFNEDLLNKYYKNREERLGYEDVLTSGDSQKNRIKNIFLPRVKYIRGVIKSKDKNNLKSSRLLDIGCASGQFLSSFNGENDCPSLFGVEAAPELATIAQKNLPNAVVYDKPFKNCNFDTNFFDIITIREVLEHMYDPYSFLCSVSAITKPDGIVFLSLPNIDGFDIQILWDKGNAFSPPSHLNYFRKSSVNKLIERAGLIVEDISTPGKLDVDIVRNRIDNHPDITDRLGKFFTNILRKKSAESDLFAEKLQNTIQECGLSSHMVIACSKKT